MLMMNKDSAKSYTRAYYPVCVALLVWNMHTRVFCVMLLVFKYCSNFIAILVYLEIDNIGPKVRFCL